MNACRVLREMNNSMDKYSIKVKGIVKVANQYLLLEHWYDDRIEDPYQWEFIDGKIEFGEAPDQAVIRIIKEATGLDAMIDKILYTWSYMLGDECNIGISYLCLAVSDEVQLSEEYTGLKWVTKDEFELYIRNHKLLEDIERAEL